VKGAPTECLRDEAITMEKLSHGHVVKLVGTYSRVPKQLFILMWPVAVCSLQDLLFGLDELRSGQTKRRADILKMLQALELKDLSAVDPLWSSQNAVSGGKCPLRRLEEIMGCLAHTVRHMHHASVRHRDIKPSNILLCPDRVYVTDFGVSRDVTEDDNTMTLDTAGTHNWLAPEAERPVKQEYHLEPADIFALGLVYINIATVLYGSKISDFKTAKNMHQGIERMKKLHTYQDHLARQALTTLISDADALTFAPRHIIGLTRWMTSMDPKSRPKALDVERELVSLGGIEQIYFTKSCCAQPTRVITEAFDIRLSTMAAARDTFRAESKAKDERIDELLRAKETLEMRVESTKNTFAAHQAIIEAKLQKQWKEEREQRELLETKLAALEKGHQKRSMRSVASYAESPRIPGGRRPEGLAISYGPLRRPQTHPAPVSPSAAPEQNRPVPQRPAGSGTAAPTPQRRIHSDSLPVPSGRLAAFSVLADPIPRPHSETSSSFPTTPTGNGYPLRPSASASRLPRPTDRNTPTRTGTPVGARTPSFNPEMSMTDSTRASMGSSIHSLRSVETVPTPVDGSPIIGRASTVTPKIVPVPVAHINTSPDIREEELSANGEVMSISTLTNPASPTMSASIPPSSSAFSSPRIARAELADGPDDLGVPKVPSFKHDLSWAEMAGKKDDWAPKLTKIVKDGTTKKAAAKAAAAKEEPTKEVAQQKASRGKKHLRS
jgi:serine/threonine protein kinase